MHALNIAVDQVKTKADRDAFIQVPFSIYQDGDNWVPPLMFERHEHINPDKNPYFQHAEVAMWIARRGGKPVGRISAQICALYLERYQDKTGQFGFLEAIDDIDVFKALLRTAEDWLKQRNITRILGPFSFSINDEMGLLIDGFDSPPSMMMGHAKPYYAQRLETLGFEKAKDVFAYDYHTDSELPRAARAMVDRARASGEIKVRPFDKNKFDRDIAIVLDIFNSAWSENWGYVPMTDKEIIELGNNLKMLVRGDYIAIAEHKGEPVAMAVSLPNINDAIKDLKGRLFPFGIAKLIWRLKLRPPRSIRLTLLGVRKAFHGTPLGAALALSVIDTVRNTHKARGTHHAELSWILEDNMPMRRMIEMIGGVAYKTYRIYQKPISRDPA